MLLVDVVAVLVVVLCVVVLSSGSALSSTELRSIMMKTDTANMMTMKK